MPLWVEIVFLLPVVQLSNAWRYASEKQTVTARIATFVLFLPLVALISAVWAFCWIVVLKLTVGV